MAKQVINIGALPNDNTGDNLRDSFNKTNLNFTELYANAEIEVWDLYGDSQTPVPYTGGTPAFKLTNDGAYRNNKILTNSFDTTSNRLDLSTFEVGANIELTIDLQLTTTVVNQVCFFEFFASIGDPNAWDANLTNELFYKNVGTHRIIVHVKYPIEFASDLANPAEIRFYSDDDATIIPRFLHIMTKFPISKLI